MNVESAAAAFAVTNNLPFSQNLPRDHKSLNFAGAFADGAQFHVAVKLLGRIILDEAIAAVNLYRFIRYADGHFSRIKFRHARFARKSSVVIPRGNRLVGKPRRLVSKQTCRFDLHSHVRELELNRLKLSNRLAELFALLYIA